jgi:hypothetical protein
LALDESSESDTVYELDGYKFVMSPDLAKDATYFKVDISYMGFTVSSDIPMPSNGGGCGSSCNVSGCGGAQ